MYPLSPSIDGLLRFIAYERYFLISPNVIDSFVIGYCFKVLKGFMNFDVARAPCTSSTLNVKNVDIKEFELITSFVNIVRTLFSEYGTNY